MKKFGKYDSYRADVLQWLNAGESVTSIAKNVGVAPSYMYVLARRWGISLAGRGGKKVARRGSPELAAAVRGKERGSAAAESRQSELRFADAAPVAVPSELSAQNAQLREHVMRLRGELAAAVRAKEVASMALDSVCGALVRSMRKVPLPAAEVPSELEVVGEGALQLLGVASAAAKSERRTVNAAKKASKKASKKLGKKLGKKRTAQP